MNQTLSAVPTPAAKIAATNPPAAANVAGKRLASIDAYRGLVMFLMLAEVLELFTLAKHFPGNQFFEWVKFHTTHVQWVGCSLHDMIQPSFSFLVGVSLPFSIASRREKGASWGSMLLHAFWRGVILVVLGIVLRSLGHPITNFRFDDTLTQIGLGYFLLFLIAITPRWNQLLWAGIILVGYWLLFALWPVVPADFNYQAVGVPNDWPHLLSGFEAHWNKNVNPASIFDVWFMNQFPREAPFEFFEGGYTTLNFIPTLATMIFGVLSRRIARSRCVEVGAIVRQADIGAGDDRRSSAGQRMGAGLLRNLPEREAHLDARVSRCSAVEFVFFG